MKSFIVLLVLFPERAFKIAAGQAFEECTETVPPNKRFSDYHIES